MDDITRRVGRIEDDYKEIRSDLKALRTETNAVRIDLAEIKGRIDGIDKRFAHIPTSLQLIGFAVAIIVASGLMRWADRIPGASPAPATLSAPR